MEAQLVFTKQDGSHYTKMLYFREFFKNIMVRIKNMQRNMLFGAKAEATNETPDGFND
ncbi:MAG: hypothetical protein P4M14_13235 [Gammaproteobacteria bacterium]|nr:hypothetical protein [Gammaproteobacteria bacterium]